MTQQVYSARLWAVQGFSSVSPLPVYTSPAGIRTVLHTASVVWGDIIISGLDFWIEGPSGAKLVRVTYATGLGPPNIGSGQVWTGRWVIEPGEVFKLSCDTGTVDTWGSGYQLTLP